jgi:argininosuccinate lyase
VSRTVRHGLATGKDLGELPLDELRRFSPLIGPDAISAISVEASLRARNAAGGTSPEAVQTQLARARAVSAE